MNNKQDANRQLVMYLFDMVEKFPELRFSQILDNLKVVDRELFLNKSDLHCWKDEFYLESDKLLERVEIAAEKLLKEDL